VTAVTTYVKSDDGVDVAVHDSGGSGHPLVAVHGTGMVARMWEPVLGLLPADQVRILYVDLRGHGATRTPDGVAFDDDRMVADLTAVAEAFELDGAWAAAHSMGAATALLTSVERPKTFSKVFAFEPIIFRRDPSFGGGDPEFLEAVKRRKAVFPSREAALDRYTARPPLDVLSPETLRAYVDHGFVDDPEGVRLACDPAREARIFNEFLRNGYERLRLVTADVILGAGNVPSPDDEPRHAWLDVAAQIPNCRYVEFDGADHFGPFATGHVEKTAALLMEFFGLVGGRHKLRLGS
jgi:pimeloyl-ACP methyl ester carboxylesterase